jgi:hypothetical protein
VANEIEKCIAGDPEDGSVNSSLVRNLTKMLGGNPEELCLARLGIADDTFFLTFAAIANSFVAAAWVLHRLCFEQNRRIRG